MTNKDKYYVKRNDKYGGYWCHRTPLKVIVNPVLRFIQFWTDTPYVVASKTEWIDKTPFFLGYTFQPVKYVKDEKDIQNKHSQKPIDG